MNGCWEKCLFQCVKVYEISSLSKFKIISFPSQSFHFDTIIFKSKLSSLNVFVWRAFCDRITCLINACDNEDECLWWQAALPEPVGPPVAGKRETSVADQGKGPTLSWASWGPFSVGLPPPHQTLEDHIWRNGPPVEECRVTPEKMSVRLNNHG